MNSQTLFEDLTARGLIAQSTSLDELTALFLRTANPVLRL